MPAFCSYLVSISCAKRMGFFCGTAAKSISDFSLLPGQEEILSAKCTNVARRGVRKTPSHLPPPLSCLRAFAGFRKLLLDSFLLPPLQRWLLLPL